MSLNECSNGLDPDALRADVVNLIRSKIDSEAEVGAVTTLKQGIRGDTVRFLVQMGTGRERAVIAKRIKGEPGHGFNDWAGLTFLSWLEATSALVSHLLGGSEPLKLHLLADLGDDVSFAEILASGDGAAVTRSLALQAEALARVVATTRNAEQNFYRLRQGLPGTALNRQREVIIWMRAQTRVSLFLSRFSLDLPPGVDASPRAIAALYREPGRWLAFCHGDPAPSNNVMTADAFKLIDFEFAAYRHALYDVTAWQVLCPSPYAWVRQLRHDFRWHLASEDSLTLDDEFSFAWDTLVCYRALAMFFRFPATALEQDVIWADEWTVHAGMISTAIRLEAAAGLQPSLAPVALLAAQLRQKLQARWPRSMVTATSHGPARRYSVRRENAHPPH